MKQIDEIETKLNVLARHSLFAQQQVHHQNEVLAQDEEVTEHT